MSRMQRALLEALISGPGYGLELVERVRERTGGEIVLSLGQTHPSLRALERDGLVESFAGESVPERGGRPRIYYRLTGAGRRALMEGQRSARFGCLEAGRMSPGFV